MCTSQPLNKFALFDQQKDTYIAENRPKNYNSKNNKNNKLWSCITELASRLVLGSDNSFHLIHPSDTNLINHGRKFKRVPRFLGLTYREELLPTSDPKLSTTPELVALLGLELQLTFSSSILWEKDYYYYRQLSDCTNVSESAPALFAVNLVKFLRKFRTEYNGTDKDKQEEGSKGKEKEQSTPLQQWIANPEILRVGQIKEMRKHRTKEDEEFLFRILEEADVSERERLPVEYTALRLLEDIYDPYELDNFSNDQFYKVTKPLQVKYKDKYLPFLKLGKKISVNYGLRIQLKKNRGMGDRHYDLRPGAREKKKIRTFLLKHFNFAVYYLTGKIRTLNLPNSCGFDALRNSYEYNQTAFPSARLMYILNDMPNLRDKVTYLGIQASTMSYIIDALNHDVDVVDHDLGFIFRAEGDFKQPGHIQNLNQHYTYSLDAAECKNYRELNHSEAADVGNLYSGGLLRTVLPSIWQHIVFGFKIDIALCSGLVSAFTIGHVVQSIGIYLGWTIFTTSVLLGASALFIFVFAFLFSLGFML